MIDTMGIKQKKGKELTLREHLEELRRRLIWSVIAIVITTGVSFVFAGRIFEFFQSRAPKDTVFIVIEVQEKMSVYMQVCLYLGFVLALPFLIYQTVMFIRPALTPTEKKYLYILLPAVVVCFFAGAAFTYYIFLPPALDFLINFSLVDAVPQIRIGSYISMIAKLLLIMGLVFELPLVIYFLTRIGVVTPQGLIRFWRYAFVGAFIVSAIVTPTIDPLNQTIVAFPMILLYGLGILLSMLAQRQRASPEESKA